jgi:cysteine desulfurase
LGKKSRSAIDASRKKIAGLIGADSDEIIFTGGGTESDNLAILGTAKRMKKYGKHVITTNIEHPAVRNAFKRLQVEGFEVSYIEVDKDGLISADSVEKAIRDDTIFISVMYVNNEVGTIQPIEEIGEIAYKNDIIFHCDAVQALGKTPINLQKLKVDLLSVSAHKINGPKGVGMLYYRGKGMHKKYNRYIQPIIYGGGQEFSYRPSTENVVGIVGFAKAVEIAIDRIEEKNKRLTNFRDDFINWVLAEIPNSHLNGHPTKRVSININLRFDGIRGDELLYKLDEKGIAISTGSACHSKSKDTSFVLRAIGLSDDQGNGSVRITLGLTTTKEDLDYTKKTLKECVEELRKN